MSDNNDSDDPGVIGNDDVRITQINSNVLENTGIKPMKLSDDVNEQEMEDIQLSDSRATSATFGEPNNVEVVEVSPTSTVPHVVDEANQSLGEKITITISQPLDEPTPVENDLVNEDLATQLKHTTVIHSCEETTDETFSRLKEGFLNKSLSQKEITDGLFNLLVGGPFDLESRFIIEHSENIDMMLEFIDICPQKMQAEIWSVFVAIVRKSFRNLEACSCIGLISKCLDRLPIADAITSDFLIQLLCVLTNYSITVKETKRVLRALQACDNVWSKNSAKLLSVMQEMPKREGADVFFSFPGKASAGIALPPLYKWPYQNGWTFSTWFRMDPLNSVNFEKETPYLFSFGTAKGLGYHCYFMGNCLVLRCTRAANKELTRCIRHELTPRKWHHVALSYVYSRWGKGEIHCYIDGQLVEAVESSWVISSTVDYFDRCFVGCGHEADVNEAFCGQIAAIYVFSQSISVHQANCLYRLGASYQSHFKHDAESNLPEGYKKHLFDGRLNSALVFAYCPKNYHGQLCLFPQSQSRAQSSSSYFVQVPHAIMRNGVEVITTHSIHNSLHSVGGIQMLLPFFAQIDMPHQHDDDEPAVDYEICLKLLSVISLLLSASASVQQQLFHSQGFLIIAYVLKTSAKEHLTLRVLDSFIAIAKQLQGSPIGLPLLKQLFEHIFFTPQLWIRTSASIQLRLYNFLANANFLSVVSRTETIVGLMHTLKVYYYIVPPSRVSDYSVHVRDDDGAPTEERLERATVVQIRGHILQLINKLMFGRHNGQQPNAAEEHEMNRDEEFQCAFNFIATVHEDDNLYDVLNQTMRQMCEHPAVMVPAFDRKKGLCVIFELIKSGNELIRIPALKTFAYFLCRSTMKRKNESINNLNLLYLLVDNILANCRHLTVATYNALFELLTEQINAKILFVEHDDLPADTVHFENPPMLKVIATLIIQSEECDELLKVKRLFLQDLLRLCKDSRENRRVILQMSVWQEWLISSAYVFPENAQQEQVTNLVYDIFAVLLFHAIRLEYGGWRVWVDTLAIAHSKVSWQKHRRKSAKNALRAPQFSAVDLGKESQRDDNTDEPGGEATDSERPSPLYRTPNFVWSDIHIRLLSDLLSLIEDVVEEWNSSTVPAVEHISNSDNQVFISNVIHVLSQLIDSLIMACGGLLPLLAAATAPNSELDIVDSTQQELSIETAVQFLQRFVELADVFVFASGVNLNELEQEKNMPSGGILRQSLRLVSTMAVRNILACRIGQKDRGFSEISISSREKYVAILKFVNKAIESDKGISNVDSLLQEVDLKRLRGIIYRDMEEGRHAQFLALSIVYLLSVLMVSRYRDILEPPTSPSPFFDTNSDSSARRKSVESSTSSKHKSTSSSASTPISSRNDISAEATQPKTEADGNGLPNGVGNGHKADETPRPSKAGESAANGNTETEEAKEKTNEENDDESEANNGAEQKISSIRFESTATENENGIEDDDKNEQDRYDTGHLTRFNTAEVKTLDATERRHYLTLKLQKALESAAPLLREIMTDFRSFLQRALLGTHGQEIMNDAKVLQCLKSQQGSVIELVMLLCSQEWQTSLQKHAGLAFIELVNEGRLMAHATRDHILRVANEADFIIKRLRAEDVSKHSRFEKETTEEFAVRKREEQISDHLRHSSKRRDFLIAVKLLEKMRMILLGPSGAWSDSAANSQTFWRLDVWEDDSRRRKRFVPNPFGRRHSLPVLNTSSDVGDGSAPTSEQISDLTANPDGDEHEKQLKDLAHKVNAYGKVRPNAKTMNNSTKGELVDDVDKWDDDESSSELRDRDQFSYNVQCKLIAAGIVVPGTISITSSDVYFDADEEDPLYMQQDPQCLRFCDNLHGRWHFQEIRAIFLRRYALQYVALEIFVAARMAIMFAFPDQDTVRNVVDHLPCVGVGVKYGIPQSRKASLMSPRQIFAHSDMQQKWQRREISNFDYLMFLNTIAGRTYNDLNQYPVFPWVLSNYTSSRLDLSEASNFRNLSKPVGALSESRRKYFQDRFSHWDDDSVPAFHYGTHYSTQAFTLNWMFRIEPFTTYFLSLQNGKLDHSDRLFYSLAETWEHCQRDTHDVKELIPELFYLPEMFSNANHYDFGRRQEDNALVHDVVLPPWAKSPEHFVMLHRQALESDLVSCQLNQWIDLIFGYKQRGPEAASATNVFYYLTYEGAIDLDSLDPTMREAVQQQILNFGQTPVQLMTDPHPPRHSVMTMSPMMFQPCNEDLCMLMKFISNSAIVHITANTFPQLSDPTVLSISQNLIFALNRWNSAYNQAQTQSSSALSSALAVSSADSRLAGSESASSGGSAAMTTAELPLTVDPLLAVGNPSQPPARRHLGDTFDQRLQISWSNFVCTPDSKFIFACGYPDYSFRIIDTENATVRQVIYGHGDVVTCLARSEMGLFTDCYIASGSADCTVVLWHFNHANQVIAGEYNLPGETPSPRAILTGHDAEITAICVSAEHGLIISGSKDGTVLMHTTQGDLLRHIAVEPSGCEDGLPPSGPITNLLLSRECHLVVFYDGDHLAVFNTSSGRQLNHPIHRSAEKVLCAVLSRDGEYIVLGTANGRISVLRLFPLQLLYTFPQTDSPTRCVAVSMNQRLIFGGLESGAIVVFNVDFNKWHYEYKQRYSYR